LLQVEIKLFWEAPDHVTTLGQSDCFVLEQHTYSEKLCYSSSNEM